MTISTDTEKAFEKNPTGPHDKNRIERNFLKWIKGI